MSLQRFASQAQYSYSLILYMFYVALGFPGGSDGKESACNAGDPGSIPGLGRPPGNPLQYSCLENFKDRGASQATVCGVSESLTQLSD